MEATQVCCLRFMQDIGDDPNIVFSCVEFNETADKPFEAAPPSVAAAKLRQRKGITPADGTVYMAGWQAAYCNCFGIVLDHFSRLSRLFVSCLRRWTSYCAAKYLCFLDVRWCLQFAVVHDLRQVRRH